MGTALLGLAQGRTVLRVRNLRHRLIAALTLALLLLSSTAFGRVATFCKMAGRTVGSCCCHHTATAELPKRSVGKAASAPTARRAACCEQRTAKSSQVPASLGGEVTQGPPPAVVVTELAEVASTWSVQTQHVVPRVARGPPRHGPPLYIEHCALLN